MEQVASATWLGNLKEGKGTLNTASGILKETPYSFKTRFEGHPGTNPEELIAAAHAGCFTMALSAALTAAGFTPEKLTTEAVVTLAQVNNQWTISHVQLTLQGSVPNITREQFQDIANDAKQNCPVSRLFNATITLAVSM